MQNTNVQGVKQFLLGAGLTAVVVTVLPVGARYLAQDAATAPQTTAPAETFQVAPQPTMPAPSTTSTQPSSYAMPTPYNGGSTGSFGVPGFSGGMSGGFGGGPMGGSFGGGMGGPMGGDQGGFGGPMGGSMGGGQGGPSFGGFGGSMGGGQGGPSFGGSFGGPMGGGQGGPSFGGFGGPMDGGMEGTRGGIRGGMDRGFGGPMDGGMGGFGGGPKMRGAPEMGGPGPMRGGMGGPKMSKQFERAVKSFEKTAGNIAKAESKFASCQSAKNIKAVKKCAKTVFTSVRKTCRPSGGPIPPDAMEPFMEACGELMGAMQGVNGLDREAEADEVSEALGEVAEAFAGVKEGIQEAIDALNEMIEEEENFENDMDGGYGMPY